MFSEICVSSESLNQVMQVERKTIPFHVDFKIKPRESIVDIRTRKSHGQMGKIKIPWVGPLDISINTSGGRPRNPQFVRIPPSLVGDSKAGSPTTNLHTTGIVSMAGGDDDGSFRPKW